jgi:adenosylmethionine---8-amino-7-oxononanoate aminotransferase
MNSCRQNLDRLWFPFTCSEDLRNFPPALIERGEGVYVYDNNGKRYLDAIGSWWVSILGHCHPRINAAVKRQVDRLEHVMMAGFVTGPALDLSQKLSEILPGELSKIFYSDNGSTSVEIAMKIALQFRAATGSRRRFFVSLGSGYHGDTLGAMSVGGIMSYHGLFHELFKKQLFTLSPYCYRCPVGKDAETCNADCMDSLEEILKNHGDDIAACIFEPMVQGACGMRIYPAVVLRKIFTLCEKYGIITIADEVAAGFARTGRMFACEHAGVVPDIMCIAKGLTGGYLPMAATIVKEKIYEVFCGNHLQNRELAHGHTFTGNPVAAAAACETLSILKEMRIPASLESLAEFFRKAVFSLNELECVDGIRTIGTIGAFEIVSDRKTKAAFSEDKRIPFRIAVRALDKGVIIRPLGNVLYFVPAYIITHEQIETMISVTKEAIKEIVYE